MDLIGVNKKRDGQKLSTQRLGRGSCDIADYVTADKLCSGQVHDSVLLHRTRSVPPHPRSHPLTRLFTEPLPTQVNIMLEHGWYVVAEIRLVTTAPELAGLLNLSLIHI